MSGGDAILETDLAGLERVHRGKVRDVYRVDDEHLLLVATDRLSAFDRVLATPIPGKGAVLTQTSCFWFGALAEATDHHLVTGVARAMPPAAVEAARALGGRAALVKRARVVPVECVVRGYLAGSVQAAYERDGAIQGVALPPGIPLGGALPAPIFTPTTKAAAGHDEPLTRAELDAHVGPELAAELERRSLALFAAASRLCATRGLILCDTKLEFGHLPDGRLVLVDEAFTPDSSRFFLASEHQPGRPPAPWDKQLVRDYLKTLPPGAMEAPEPPGLPDAVVRETAARYREVFERLAGRPLADAVAEAVA